MPDVVAATLDAVVAAASVFAFLVAFVYLLAGALVVVVFAVEVAAGLPMPPAPASVAAVAAAASPAARRDRQHAACSVIGR